MKKLLALILFFVFTVIFSENIFINAATAQIDVPESVNIGETFNIYFVLDADEPIYALQGNIELNKSGLSIENNVNGYKFVESLNGISHYQKTISCKALETGKYTVYVNDIKYVPFNEIIVNADAVSAGLKIINPDLPSAEIKIIPPNTTEYPLNAKLNCNGGSVMFYSYGVNEENINLTDNLISGFDSSAIGTKTVTVTYNNAVASFDVVVYNPDNTVYGDVNSDGEFNVSDLVRLKLYLAGKRVPILKLSSDVDGDTFITATDLIRIKKILAGVKI